LFNPFKCTIFIRSKKNLFALFLQKFIQIDTVNNTNCNYYSVQTHSGIRLKKKSWFDAPVNFAATKTSNHEISDKYLTAFPTAREGRVGPVSPLAGEGLL